MPTITISGHIYDRDTAQAIENLKVELWDEDLIFDDVITETTSGRSGLFEFYFSETEFTTLFGDRTPDLTFKVFQDEAELTITSDAILHNVQAGSYQIEVIVDQTYSVQGKLIQPDGTPLANFDIKPFDKSLNAVAQLGLARTGTDGQYVVNYTRSQLADPTKQFADLYVEVQDQNTGALVMTSPLILNAFKHEVVNLVLDEESYTGPSEFSRHASLLEPELSQLNLSDIDPACTLMLSNATGVPATEVAMYVRASLDAQQSGIAAEVLYGLFRQAQSPNLKTLVNQDLDAIRAGLEAAAGQGQIASTIPDNWVTIEDKIQDTRAMVSLQTSSGSSNPLPEYFDIAGINLADQAAIMNAYVRNQDSPDDFWQQMKTSYGAGEIEVLQLALQLSAVTHNHVPLVQALIEEVEINDLRELAALEAGQIEDIIDDYDTDVPEDIPGANSTEKAKFYAEQIARIVEEIYPTPVLAHRIAGLGNPDLSRVSSYALQNPSLDLRYSNLDQFLLDNVPSASDLPALERDLPAMQRLFRIAPVHDKTPVIKLLWDEGLKSSHAIHRMGKPAFLRKFGAGLGEATALYLYKEAEKNAARSLATVSLFNEEFKGDGTNVTYSGDLEGGENNVPDLKKLFGAIDFCNCKHCRSVLSPAAYLVDLLVFLQNAEGLVQPTALDELLERRPDIAHLELSCENTNTQLPYIDLINEILEQAVANLPNPTNASETPQTTQGTASLGANPEHMVVSAYDILANAQYPWQLPFNLWREEVTVFLDHLGIKRDLLMRLLPSTVSPNFEFEIAAESLGIIPAEANLIVIPETQVATLENHFGIPGGNLLQDLEKVTILLDVTDLSFEELKTLCQMRFVNPGGLVTIDFPNDPCDLEDAIFTGLTVGFLDRMHRFVRLMRKTGWKALELDQTFIALGATEIDGFFIQAIANIQSLQARYSLSIEQLLTWWGNIDTGRDAEEDSLYKQLFLNPSVNNPTVDLEALFGLNVNRDELAYPGDPILDPGFLPFVLAAVNLNGAELTAILSVDLPNGEINLASLSHLYRVSVFCNTLNISVADYLALRALGNVDALGGNPSDTIEFIELLDRIERVGLDLASLNYLLLHQVSEQSSLVQNDIEIAVLLDELRKDLRGLSSGTTQTSKRNELEAQLGMFLDEDKTAFAMTIVEKGEAVNISEWSQLITDHLGFFLDVPDAIAELVDPENTELVIDRINYVHIRMLAFLKENLVVSKLAAALTIPTAMVEAMLKEWLPNPDASSNPAMELFTIDSFAKGEENIERSSFGNLYSLYDHLAKVALVVGKLGIDIDGLEFLFNEGAASGMYDIRQFPLVPTMQITGAGFATWMSLAEAVNLQNEEISTPFSVFQLLKFAHENTSSGDRTKLLDNLASSTGWESNDITFLTGPSAFNLTYPADYQKPKWLSDMAAVMPHIIRLGLPAAQVASLTTSNVSATEAAMVRNAVKSKYDNERWLKIAPGLRNELRERQRNALQAYLIASNPDFENTDDLYAYYLIDTEMSSCSMTSRIVQANASIQLLVQRIGMNLESNISFQREDSEQWKWRKNYRVWEANRKVFLYPENWIEPDLRDDKSPLFLELENALQQDALSSETVEAAYLNYLKGLDNVANLEVAGICRDDEQKVLHVFARSKGTPSVFYYRKWVDSNYWTAWERVDLEIRGKHLIPSIYNRRLYLFWPEILEKPSNPEIENSAKDWEIKIAWSELQQGRWSRKRVSEPYNMGKTSEQEELFFKLNERGQFRVMKKLTAQGTYNKTVFTFNDCTGNIERPISKSQSKIPVFPQKTKITLPADSVVLNQKFVEWGSNHLGLPDVGGKEEDMITVLKAVSGQYEITWTQQDTKLYADYPFFYQDQYRAFFVVPTIIETKDTPQRYFPHPDTKDKLELGDLYRAENQYWKSLINPNDPVVQDDPGVIDLGSGQMYYSQKSNTQIINRSNTTVNSPTFKYGYGGEYALTDSEVGSLSETLTPVEKAGVYTRYAVKKRYQFSPFYHPYTCLFLKHLNRYGVGGLLNPNPATGTDAEELSYQLTPGSSTKFDFQTTYIPSLLHVSTPFPKEDIDFSAGGAFSQYNWELFFHCPFQIAISLSTDQKFAEAQKWFHYIFDPTESQGEAPARFWKVKPFHEFDANTTIQEIMQLINEGDEELEALVDRWEKDPFKPHLIARYRLVAYMRAVVMKYLENLIAWGDQLFRQDTRESLNEATQLYILAAQILGRRPVRLEGETGAVQTFDLMRADLDAFSNSLVDLENVLQPSEIDSSDESSGGLTLLNSILYFCIPENSKLLGYWDTVANRLFKLRNCLNIEGVFRQLPLFQPTIDPALLVKAVASGVDLNTALNDLNAPLPIYRFQYLLPRAMDFANEVRSLGASLLSALEKRDAEAMSLLRASHESTVSEALKAVSELQVEEAQANLENLKQSKEGSQTRYQYYKNILHTSPGERKAMMQRESANFLQMVAQGYDLAASIAHLIPDIQAGLAAAAVTGGKHFGNAMGAYANVARMFASSISHQGDRTSVVAGYDRRWEEWKLQEKLAENEIKAIEKQIAAGEIRLAMAKKDVENQDLNIQNAEEAKDFLEYKYTNVQLYNWTVSQLSSLYFQAYQMAYDLAKRVEQCYRFELGIENSNFIQFGYWDSLKKGLLSGERISNDLRRMESAYLSNNRREYEVTKHVSIGRLDPNALLEIRENGEATVHIPEATYDLDFPSQYMRRIKNVRLTIPCITGPHTSISCKLTLMGNRYRKNTSLVGEYAYKGINDIRFVQNTGGFDAIATSSAQGDSGLFELNFRDERYLPFEGAGAISSWKIQLPDEYRQFDYDSISDVVLHISYMAREGGEDFRNDVEEHLETGFNQILDEVEASETGLVRMFSLRQEFPNEFYQLLHPVIGQSGQQTELNVSQQHLPFFLKPSQLATGKTLVMKGVSLLWKLGESYRTSVAGDVGDLILDIDKDSQLIEPAADATYEDQDLNNLPRTDYAFTSGHPVGKWTLLANDTQIGGFPSELRTLDDDGHHRIIADAVEDIYLVVNYKIASTNPS